MFGTNTPNVLQFMYALRRMLITNSIEPLKTGNCTSFEDSLCDSSGFVEISWKRKQCSSAHKNIQSDAETFNIKRMLIKIDHLSPDNILYYISNFIVRILLFNHWCGMDK